MKVEMSDAAAFARTCADCDEPFVKGDIITIVDGPRGAEAIHDDHIIREAVE